MNCTKNEMNQIINSAVNNAMARRNNTDKLDDLVDLSEEEVSNISGGLSIAPEKHYPIDFHDPHPTTPFKPIRPIYPPLHPLIRKLHDPLIVGIIVPPDYHQTH
jgi:hypothetical protein